MSRIQKKEPQGLFNELRRERRAQRVSDAGTIDTGAHAPEKNDPENSAESGVGLGQRRNRASTFRRRRTDDDIRR
jgi:hypothetical protein